MGKKFTEKDRVLILCGERRWLIPLSQKKFGTHMGEVDLAQVVGKEEGFSLKMGRERMFFFRPTLEDFLFKVKRNTGVIFPKDIATILLYADVQPADKIIETGTGSGALLTAMLTRVTKGRIITIDNRPEFQDIARINLTNYFGAVPKRVTFVQADSYDPDTKLPVKKNWADKVFFDLPEPWQALALLRYLRPGGVLMAYNPQITQLQRLAIELLKMPFADFAAMEILKRDWLVDEERARPADNMRGHTGFLMFVRKTS